MRPLVVLLAVLAATASAALHGASGGSARHLAATGPLLGVTGNTPRFKAQTGQETLVDQAFLGWGQGQTYGSQFAALLPTLGPIPMLHLGTGGRDRKEVITPGDIASGKGDSYLYALNKAIAVWAKGIYVRPMAEMNNPANFYSGFTSSGAAKGPAYTPATFRKAFARIYLLLHGGTATQINAKLRSLGLPPVTGGDLLANPFPRVRVLWSPLATGSTGASNATQYYPGKAYVDVEGGDIYDEHLTDTAPWQALESLYKASRQHGKPFSVPEWGLFNIDDQAFMKHMCTFLSMHPATEVSVFYESKPGSIFDLGTKPQSRQTYAGCITPLGGPLPPWAGATATVGSLVLTPKPAAGPNPLNVQFSITAKLSVPAAHWQVLFGDGSAAEGAGSPPATLQHTYQQAFVYGAALFIYQAPPFTPQDAFAFTSANVSAGSAPQPNVSFVPTPASGKPPLSVSFRTDLKLPGAVTSWTMVFGDGSTRTQNGSVPHFTGHTFTTGAAFRVLLLLNSPGGRRYAAVASVNAGGGPPTTTTVTTSTTSTTTTTTPAPPATGTATGTVTVNGRAFTTGVVPYNSTVDVTDGTLVLRTDTGSVRLFGQNRLPAIFKLVRGTDQGRPVVEFRLQGGNFSVCPKRKKSGVSRIAATTVRQLWGSGKGRFRTRGRYAAATVRGTIWLTADRCDGTFIRVRQGVIQVNDLPRRRLITLRAGRTLLVKP